MARCWPGRGGARDGNDRGRQSERDDAATMGGGRGATLVRFARLVRVKTWKILLQRRAVIRLDTRTLAPACAVMAGVAKRRSPKWS